jgi:hypothetical protein
MHPKNITAARQLMKFYKTVTLETIKDVWNAHCYECSIIIDGELIARKLIGFNRYHSCSLCKAVNSQCALCIYAPKNGPKNAYMKAYCGNSSTYKNIKSAKTPEELLTAFRKRATFIQRRLNAIAKRERV